MGGEIHKILEQSLLWGMQAAAGNEKNGNPNPNLRNLRSRLAEDGVGFASRISSLPAFMRSPTSRRSITRDRLRVYAPSHPKAAAFN